ncbi:MAG: N-acetyltransferase [Armatimonadota bacterium]|nr:N-acetyltransferase [Armatimonadota bacterium]
MAMQIRWAKKGDLDKVRILAQAHRNELGFVHEAVLKKAIVENRLFVAVSNSSSSFASHSSSCLIGFVHFRCSRDGHATIYEIAVAPEWRRQGVGKELVKAVIWEAIKRGCRTLRLKCPIDLPANGFYSRLGFVRIAIEDGKKRPLAVWELDLLKENFEGQSKQPTFFVTLTHEATEIRKILCLAFSRDSIRGVLNWLRALDPPVVTNEGKANKFRRRYFCPIPTFFWGLDFLYRINKIAYGVRMFLTSECIEQLCKVCVLDPSGLENVLMMAKRIGDYERGGKHHKAVKGIFILTSLWTGGKGLISFDFRVYDKPISVKTKDRHFRKILRKQREGL